MRLDLDFLQSTKFTFLGKFSRKREVESFEDNTEIRRFCCHSVIVYPHPTLFTRVPFLVFCGIRLYSSGSREQPIFLAFLS